MCAAGGGAAAGAAPGSMEHVHGQPAGEVSLLGDHAEQHERQPPERRVRADARMRAEKQRDDARATARDGGVEQRGGVLGAPRAARGAEKQRARVALDDAAEAVDELSGEAALSQRISEADRVWLAARTERVGERVQREAERQLPNLVVTVRDDGGEGEHE